MLKALVLKLDIQKSNNEITLLIIQHLFIIYKMNYRHLYQNSLIIFQSHLFVNAFRSVWRMIEQINKEQSIIV